MSKDKLPKDMFSPNDILSEVAHKRPTTDPQETHKGTTNDPQTTHDVGPLKKRHIRIADNDWQRLQDYFSSQGLSVSAGIRMIIKQYMSREGIN